MIFIGQKEFNESIESDGGIDVDMHVEYQMIIRFTCPGCDNTQFVEPQALYHSFNCDNCGLKMAVDISDGEPTELSLHADEKVTS